MITVNLLSRSIKAEKRAKQAAYMREWYRKNPHKIKRSKTLSTPYVAAWRKRHPDHDRLQREKYRNKPETKAKKVEWQRHDRAKDPRKMLNRHLRRYGIRVEDYERMYEEQGGRCGICNGTQEEVNNGDRFCLDHCHKTNKARGLLCRNCNFGLGAFHDTPNKLERAIAYLKAKAT